jgi:hypothetical protein
MNSKQRILTALKNAQPEMAVSRWGEWAEAVMRMIVEVKSGENLLILADTWTDMEIAEAVLMAGINAKANAQLLVISRMARSDTGELNPSTAGAINNTQGGDHPVFILLK